MISISLLPPEFRQLSLLRRKQRLLVVTFSLVCLLLLLVLGTLSLNTRITRSQLDGVVAYQSVLERQIDSLAPYEGLYQRVTDINEIIELVMTGSADWRDLLYQLGLQVPQGVWLTDLNATSPTGASPQGDIRLRGRASHHLMVAQFLEALEMIPELSDINCLFSTSSGKPGEPIQFEITASVASKTAVMESH